MIQGLARVRTAVFDKTGTLTAGRPRVTEILPARGIDEDRLLALAGQVESGSGHPLAGAVLAAVREKGLDIPSAHGVKVVPGRGVEMETPDGILRAGSEAFLAQAGIEPERPTNDPEMKAQVLVSLGNRYMGRLVLDDTLRQETVFAVRVFNELMDKTVILSGDREESAARMAMELGMTESKGALTPGAKVEEIQALQDRGGPALMVGDGINDAPALAEAAVGCAVSGGADVALEVSDLALTRPRLDMAALAVVISRRTLRVIHQNLGWAMIYNLAAIGLAVGGKLLPVHAAAAMALSSVCVLLNSLRLARVPREWRTS